MTWQTIETAPKDGTEVLIYGGTMGNDQETYFSTHKMEFVTIAAYQGWGTCKHYWRGANCGGHNEYYWHNPTHWMPLPTIPKGGA